MKLPICLIYGWGGKRHEGGRQMHQGSHRLFSNRPKRGKIQGSRASPGLARARDLRGKATPAGPASGKHVLYVDDEAMVARMGERILKKLGYVVTALTNSVEALEAFKANPFRYDVVVTDQSMPQMSGVGLAKKLIEIRPDIPIVLTSGYGTIEDELKSRAAGIREYAPKPVEIKSLAQIIEKLVRQKLGTEGQI